ncbi:MAG: LysR family transcriptional regulator [Paracoccaceae bacterium]
MNLPPLNALRSFEAAARHGGFIGAAQELGVTPAAVSHQVRRLEDHLGYRLFLRHNNRVTLTDAGQAVYARAASALGELADLADHGKNRARQRRLVISCLPSLAETWLAQRLTTDGVAIDLRVEPDPVAFARDSIDLRITYGTNPYPDLASVRLFRDQVVPMACPEMAAHWPDLPDDRLIHTDWGAEFASCPTWSQWVASHRPGRPVPVPGTGHRVGSSLLALCAAAGGLGIALGQRALAEGLIAQGRLVVLSDEGLALEHDYVAIHPHAKSRKTALRRVLDQLVVARDIPAR